MVPFDAASLSTKGCMSPMGTPDTFRVEATNALIAVAIPVVPAPGCIVLPPIIPPPIPPMPLIEIGVEPIIPFITPSEASQVQACRPPSSRTQVVPPAMRLRRLRAPPRYKGQVAPATQETAEPG